MSQKYIKSKNNNSHNAKTYGKYYAKPVYDEKFVETDEIADFIQTQATLKRSDIKAALDELGSAMKHFLGMGQKIRLAGIGIFKVGFSSIGVSKAEDCTASTITSRRILFQPETERIVTGSGEKNGKVVQKYVNTKTLVKDVTFEELHENQYSAGGSNSNASSGSNGSGSNTSTGGNGGGIGNGGGTGTVTPSTGGGDNGGNSGSGDNNGGGNNTGDNN